MTRRPRRRTAESRWQSLEKLDDVAPAAIAGTVPLAFASIRFSAVLSPAPTRDYLLQLLGFVLLIMVVGLICLWLFAVRDERRLMHDYLEEHIRPVPGQAFVWTAFFSILLGTLGILTANIGPFCILFALYSLGDMWGQHLRDQQLRLGFREITREAARKTGMTTGRPIGPGVRAGSHVRPGARGRPSRRTQADDQPLRHRVSCLTRTAVPRCPRWTAAPRLRTRMSAPS